jgi:hypothetical protein
LSKFVEIAANGSLLATTSFGRRDITGVKLFRAAAALSGHQSVVIVGYPSGFIRDGIQRVPADTDVARKFFV